MGQHGPDIDLLTVVVNGRNESNFITTNVEDSELTDLIGRRAKLAKPNK